MSYTSIVPSGGSIPSFPRTVLQIPPPPPGLNYTALIKPTLSMLMLTTVWTVLMLPLAICLYIFSTREFRKKPIFAVNVVAISIVVAQGICFEVNLVQAITEPLNPVRSGMMIIIAVLSPLPAIVVEIILLLRLLAVYPYHRTPRTIFYAIFIPLTILKLFRLVNAIYYIALYAPLTPKAGGNALLAGLLTNELTYPGTKIEWILQAIDNSVCSILFLYRVATASQAFQRGAHRSSSSYYSRMRGLFWIASVNYVFPVPLAIATAIVVFTQGMTVTTFSLVITNAFVSVIGATLASIWSANANYHANAPSSRMTGSSATAASNSLHFNVDSNPHGQLHSARQPGFRLNKPGSNWDKDSGLGGPEGDLETHTDDGIPLPAVTVSRLPEANAHRLEYIHDP